MTQLHIVFNPISGQGDAGRELETIESILENVGELTVHLTTPENTADSLAQKALDEGADIVVAAGGDGTVSSVASALVKTDIPMGIIPRGTVNAFASAMHIPALVPDACRIIADRHVQRVDTAQCNDRTMLLLVSIGFEADLMKQLDRKTKKRFGRLAIFAKGIRQWLNLSQFQANVETDSQTLELDATAVTVANAATVQTILAQGPADVVSHDGYLDLTVVAPGGRWSALSGAADLFLSAILKQNVTHQDVEHFQASSLTISTEPAQNIIIDGELAGKTPVKVQCFKHSLSVIVPAEQ